MGGGILSGQCLYTTVDRNHRNDTDGINTNAHSTTTRTHQRPSTRKRMRSCVSLVESKATHTRLLRYERG